MEEQDREMTVHSSILQVASIITKNKRQYNELVSDNMESSKKRERSVNFTEEETEKLVALIESKKYIIESKENNAGTWQEKKKAWRDIEKKYNKNSNTVFRTSKTLRLKYEGLKRDIRKKYSLLWSGRYKNDKKKRPIKFTPAEKRVRSMMQFATEDHIYESADQTNDDSDNDNVASLPSSETKETDWPKVKEENILLSDSDVESSAYDTNTNKQIKIELETAVGGKRQYDNEDPLLTRHSNQQHEFNYNKKYDSEDLVCKDLETAELQKQVLLKDLEIKVIQKTILKEEQEHKKEIFELEKQQMKLKIELLNAKLRKTKDNYRGNSSSDVDC